MALMILMLNSLCNRHNVWSGTVIMFKFSFVVFLLVSVLFAYVSPLLHGKLRRFYL